MSAPSRLARLPLAGLAALLLSSCVSTASQRIPGAGLPIGPRSVDLRFDVEVGQTANGLRYALVPDTRSNIVTIDVRYTVGSADEPAGKTGLAHLVEHVIFSHTATAGGPSLSQRFEQTALFHNGFTIEDATDYTATALTSNLNALLALEAERMAPSCDRLSPEAFERERQVVLNETRQRPADVWADVRARVFGADHPYTHSVGGTDLATITRDDVCAFLAAHYAPSRAILVIVGPFEPGALRGIVERRFGGIKRTANPQDVLPPLVTSGESVHTANIDEPTAMIAFPAAPWGTKGKATRDLLIDLWIRRARATADSTGITGIRRFYLGGYRGGADVIKVTAAHWSKLPGAVDAVFRARDTILADEFSLGRREERSSHVNGYIGSFDQLAGLSLRVADYVQYGDHPWFMVQGFNEMEGLWPEGLAWKIRDDNGLPRSVFLDHADGAPLLRAAIDALPTRVATHVAWIQPDKRAAKMDDEPTAQPHVDVAEWKSQVDPAEADRAVPLPPLRPRTVPQQFTLPNGLTVWLAPMTGAPQVDIRVVFPAGTLSDPASLPGAAMLSAHLLDLDASDDFVSQRALAIDEVERLLWGLGLGTRLSVDVDIDTTVFRASGAARYADWHLWRLFWLLDRGGYDLDALVRLRDRAKDDKLTLSTLLATALVGPDRVPPRDGIRRIGKGDLERFRDRHYLPRGATVIVTGGFDPAAMSGLIADQLGAWSGEAPDVRYPSGKGTPTGQRQLAIADDDARQLTVAVAFPAMTSDVATHLVIEDMLAVQLDSVRSRLGVTYGVSSEYQFLDDVAPALVITGEVDPRRGGVAIDAMMAALNQLRTDRTAFTRAFVAARRRVVGRLAVRISDTTSTAAQLESSVRSHRSTQELDAVIGEVAALKPAAVRDALARDMARDKSVIAFSGRRAAIDQACREAGLPLPHYAPAARTAVSARP